MRLVFIIEALGYLTMIFRIIRMAKLQRIAN
jgi:hypothetical protein